jgi:hypothetical protein
MDENLKRLARELRNETCPQRVLDEVARRIPRRAPSPLRLKIAVAAIAAAVALAALSRWPADRNTRPQLNSGTPVAVDSAQAARQAKLALECIGAVLRDAGARSEKVILQEAVPPLRNSLQTAENKIPTHI